MYDKIGLGRSEILFSEDEAVHAMMLPGTFAALPARMVFW
jgi:hypothetical protein